MLSSMIGLSVLETLCSLHVPRCLRTQEVLEKFQKNISMQCCSATCSCLGHADLAYLYIYVSIVDEVIRWLGWLAVYDILVCVD